MCANITCAVRGNGAAARTGAWRGRGGGGAAAERERGGGEQEPAGVVDGGESAHYATVHC